MEDRDLEQEQARRARQSRIEHFILEWMIVYPFMSLAAGFAVMIGSGRFTPSTHGFRPWAGGPASASWHLPWRSSGSLGMRSRGRSHE